MNVARFQEFLGQLRSIRSLMEAEQHVQGRYHGWHLGRIGTLAHPSLAAPQALLTSHFATELLASSRDVRRTLRHKDCLPIFPPQGQGGFPWGRGHRPL